MGKKTINFELGLLPTCKNVDGFVSLLFTNGKQIYKFVNRRTAAWNRMRFLHSD